tara:strand:+ start:992 stop:1177 length:186 start_codon:yes stop_codon:yes gene_type:complete
MADYEERRYGKWGKLLRQYDLPQSEIDDFRAWLASERYNENVMDYDAIYAVWNEYAKNIYL